MIGLGLSNLQVVNGQHTQSTGDTAQRVGLEAFVLGPVIGRGASSIVRRAEPRGAGGPFPPLVALKFLRSCSEPRRRMIEAEIESGALAAGECDALTPLLGVAIDGATDDLILIFPLASRGSLDDVLRARGALPERLAFAVVFQVAWGLAWLREEHRLHRDVKPHNVLVSADGAARLSDLGLSRSVGAAPGVLRAAAAVASTSNEAAAAGGAPSPARPAATGSVAASAVGTLAFLSPERLAGDEAGYSYPADVYALGVVLYKALFGGGAHPLAEGAESLVDAALAVANAPAHFTLPRARAGSVSPDAVDVLALCLARAPGDRATAAELLGHAAFARHGLVDLGSAREVVRDALAEDAEGGAGAGAAGP